MKTYEIYHKITYSKMFKVRAKDLDEAMEKVLDKARARGDYRDYDMEDDLVEA